MFTQIFPMKLGTGVLAPVITDLVIDNVRFHEAVGAGGIVQFDFSMMTARSWSPANSTYGDASYATASGGGCVFGVVRIPDANSTAAGIAKYPASVSVFGIAVTAVAEGGLGSVRIIGPASVYRDDQVVDSEAMYMGQPCYVTVQTGAGSTIGGCLGDIRHLVSSHSAIATYIQAASTASATNVFSAAWSSLATHLAGAIMSSASGPRRIVAFVDGPTSNGATGTAATNVPVLTATGQTASLPVFFNGFGFGQFP